MIPSIKKLFIVCFSIGLASFAQQANYKKLNEFFEVLDAHDKLMGTMSIAKNNDIVYSHAIGYADLEGEILNTSATKFRIGSITKTFTAVMIFQLIEEGKLSLETPLTNYFPKLPNASKITIANLLTHSSGLFNITNADGFRTWMVEPCSQEVMLSRMLKYEAQFEPGEKNEYSNTNFILLGYIAEAIDKMPYAQILKKRIVSKIDLRDTYYGGKIMLANNECYSYSLENGQWQLANETDMTNPAGAGAIVSTTNDLTKFYAALFNNKLMTNSSLKVMTTAKGDYAHGIFTQELNGMRMYGHNGGIDGFKSFAIYIPEQNLALAIVGNGVEYGLMPILINGIAVSMGKEIVIPTFETLELTETDIQQYLGKYSCNKVPFGLVFKAEGNTLLMEVPERNLTKALTPTKKHEFALETLGIALEFDITNNQLFLKEAGAEPLLFKKL